MYIIINYVQKYGCDLDHRGNQRNPGVAAMELKDQRDEGYWNSEKRESWRTGHLKRSSDLPPAQVDPTGREPGE